MQTEHYDGFSHTAFRISISTVSSFPTFVESFVITFEIRIEAIQYLLQPLKCRFGPLKCAMWQHVAVQTV